MAYSGFFTTTHSCSGIECPHSGPPGELSSGLPNYETMRLPPLGQSWPQSPNQILDTAEEIVFCMLAKTETKIITDNPNPNPNPKWNPPGTSGGQQSRHNCKSRAQRALESPRTIDPAEGRVGSRKKKRMDTTDDRELGEVYFRSYHYAERCTR